MGTLPVSVMPRTRTALSLLIEYLTPHPFFMFIACSAYTIANCDGDNRQGTVFTTVTEHFAFEF
jgi:hypothetical protein